MKKLVLLFVVISVLAFSFCSAFALVEFDNSRFPDWPTGYSSSEPLTIIYSSDLDTYYAVYCTYNVSKLANITFGGASGYSLHYPYNGMRVFEWKPKSNFSWQYLEASGNYSTTGLYFPLHLYNRQIIYSSADILDTRGYGEPVIFFLQNVINEFYLHAKELYHAYLPDLGEDEPPWWDIWNGLDNFWDSINSLISDTFSSLVAPISSLGEAVGSLASTLGSKLESIYNTFISFFSFFRNTMLDFFIPSPDFWAIKNQEIKILLESKLGNYNEIISDLQSAFSQMANQKFEGIYIDFPPDFYISGVAGRKFYILDPSPIGAYRYRFRPWISGLMTFLTCFFCLKKVITIIRGSPTV